MSTPFYDLLGMPETGIATVVTSRGSTVETVHRIHAAIVTSDGTLYINSAILTV